MTGVVIPLGNGKFKLQISLGYVGKKQIRRFKTIEAKTQKEAEKMLAKFYLEESKFVGINKDVTFGDFAKIFEQRHSKNLSLACRTNYEYLLRTRILPAFGKVKLSKITQEMLINFVRYLRTPDTRMDNKNKEYLSGETVRKFYKLIQLMMNKAVLWNFIPTSPLDRFPVDDELPKQCTRHNPTLSEADLTRLLSVIDAHEEDANWVVNKLFFYISLTVGTRRGETAGLTWSAIDLDNRTINITQSLKIVNGRPREMGDTKNKKSRVVYFDEHLTELFRKHKMNQDKWLTKKGGRNTQNLVFVYGKLSPSGETQFFNPHTTYKWLSTICKKHYIPHITLHSLRAQFATLSSSCGVPLSFISAGLGHSSSIVTANIYIRDIADMRKDITQKVFTKLDELRGEN